MSLPKNIYVETPIIKILIPLVLGILLAIYFPKLIFVKISLLIVTLFFVFHFLIYFIKKDKTKIRLKKKLKRFSLLNFFLIGYILLFNYNSLRFENHYSKYFSENSATSFKCIAKENPISKENSLKFEAEIIEIVKDGQGYNTTGEIIIYISKPPINKINRGDVLYSKGFINEISHPKNPNEFNYKNYLRYQNIYYQTYIKHEKIIRSKENDLSAFTIQIESLKSYFQNVIFENIKGEDEKAIANALLLGNRNFLNKDILNIFASSGATHILAVSGLHVGIFYLILTFSFSWIKRVKKLSFFFPLIILIFIWIYVILTGGSPSVMRSATMFSFIILGSAFDRYINIYNTIALSALILILFNPYIITEVGFQLSYTAVIGIIYLQPKIYSIFSIKNFVMEFIWKITTVSIAAQISTFPLIVLYFHQFPNLFWISNLIVIPAATLILYIGMFMFLISKSVFLVSIIGKVLSEIIQRLNESLIFIDQIPYALTKGLYMSHLQTVLIYFFIIIFLSSFNNKKNNSFILSLCFLLIISFSFSFKHVQINQQKILTIYHIKNKSAIEFIDNTLSYLQIDSSVLNNESKMLFHIKHNWWEKGIKSHQYSFDHLHSETIFDNKLIYFHKKKILLVKNEIKTPIKPVQLDYFIVSNSPKLYLKPLNEKIKAKTYIFDSSNNHYSIKRWKKDCLELGMPCYFVSDSVAYEVHLDKF